MLLQDLHAPERDASARRSSPGQGRVRLGVLQGHRALVDQEPEEAQVLGRVGRARPLLAQGEESRSRGPGRARARPARPPSRSIVGQAPARRSREAGRLLDALPASSGPDAAARHGGQRPVARIDRRRAAPPRRPPPRPGSRSPPGPRRRGGGGAAGGWSSSSTVRPMQLDDAPEIQEADHLVGDALQRLAGRPGAGGRTGGPPAAGPGGTAG